MRVDWTNRVGLRRGLLAAFVIICLGVLLAVSLPKTYSSSAQVLIDPQRSKVVTSEEVLSGLTTESVVIDSQVEVLRSEEIKMRLFEAIGRPVAARLLDADGSAPNLFPRFAQKLASKRIGLSSVIEVQVAGRDAGAAALTANRWVDIYVRSLLAQKEEAGRTARGALAQRVADIRAQLLAADRSLQEFRNRNGFLTKDPTALAEQRALNINQALTAARVEAAEAVARARGARTGLGNIPEVLNSELIQQLREEEATNAAELAQLRARYGDAHPLVERRSSALRQIREQLRGEQERISSSLQQEAQIKTSQYSELDASYQQSLRSLEQRNLALAQLNEMQGKVEALKELYQATLSRYNDVNVQAGLGLPDARVISRAATPVEHSSPNYPLLFILTFVVASGALLAALVLTSLIGGRQHDVVNTVVAD
jgi:uncharacterized protein involved in exopolysaccharide biosynthesis